MLVIRIPDILGWKTKMVFGMDEKTGPLKFLNEWEEWAVLVL